MDKNFARLGTPSYFDEGPEVDQRLPPKIIKAMSEAFDVLSGVERRLNTIADNMLGGAPDTTIAAGTPCPSGEAHIALDLAETIIRRINDLGPVLNRLERL